MIYRILICLGLLVAFGLLAFHINKKILKTEGKIKAGTTSVLTIIGALSALIIALALDYWLHDKNILFTILFILIIPAILYYLKAWRILFGFILAYIGYLLVCEIFFLLSVTNFSL